MKLNKLSIKDKKLFSRFLSLRYCELSAYAFENIYIWKALFDIRWAIIEDGLCIFFQDKTSCFMYLPPLAKRPGTKTIEESFAIMNSTNKNKRISRIENVIEEDLPLYQDLGYEYKERAREYLCRRTDLAALKGDKFKSKRAAVNYFLKHYQFEYLPFSLKYRNECLELYEEWAKNRRAKNADYIYRAMLDDNYICLKTALDDYRNLDFEGRVIRVKGEVRGFTFGFKLNKDTFCILYEITDLGMKGISQFIFQKFCQDLTEYKYINMMDDSGLVNLRRIKLSYRPIRLIPAYNVIEGVNS